MLRAVLVIENQLGSVHDSVSAGGLDGLQMAALVASTRGIAIALSESFIDRGQAYELKVRRKVPRIAELHRRVCVRTALRELIDNCRAATAGGNRDRGVTVVPRFVDGRTKVQQ